MVELHLSSQAIMTTQTLYEILHFIDDLDEDLDLQNRLDRVSSALSNIATQPAVPQHQATLASELAAFEEAARRLAEQVTPSHLALIKSMGGDEYFDESIADKVRTAIQTNAMTPSVARDFVRELASSRTEFLQTVRKAKQALEQLKITATALKPGSADLAFLIPREIFQNELAQFAKELNFINRLLQDYSEALTGEADQVQLEQLASSIPTVSIVAGAGVISALATAVTKFLEAWEKIKKIRKAKDDLKDLGISGTATDELDERIETTVEEVVEETVEVVVAKYPGQAGRKNELTTAIRNDTRRLFGQIERGLTVEFRAKPKEHGDDDEQQKALTNIANVARLIKFPEPTPHPMLLSSGEVLEGTIQATKNVKKTTTTTHKTATRGRKIVLEDERSSETKLKTE